MTEQLSESVSFLRQKGMDAPEIGIILGTGLGNAFVGEISVEADISYNDIPHFPEATIEFHHGRLIYGSLGGRKVIAMQGRFHYYEGYSMQQITFPVRVMKKLGVEFLLISNAAGNMNMNWSKGDLMLIDDHINLQPDNPLRGKNDASLGPQFPDMSAPYDPNLNRIALECAETLGLTIRKGVYVAVMGPNLETRAEYRFLSRIGADVVGMSTVPEVIVANHMSLPCMAVSVLTDDCDPDNLAPANINDILAVAAKAEVQMTLLFKAIIQNL